MFGLFAKKKRGKTRALLRTYQGADREAGPIVTCASGSAGTNRQVKMLDALGDQAIEKVAAAIMYDTNAATQRQFKAAKKALRERGIIVIDPGFIPLQEGFGRRPYSYKQFEGSLLKDQERIAQEMRQSLGGTLPQILVQHTGPGGHAILGAELHKRVSLRLPRAELLVVVSLPRDPAIDPHFPRIWADYSKAYANEIALVTDNAVAARWINGVQELDERLGVALAAPELASIANPVNGSLADTLSSLRPREDRGGWLGVSVVKDELPADLVRGPLRPRLHLIPIGRKSQLKIPEGRAEALMEQVKQAVLQSFSSEAQLALHESPPDDVPQRVFVLLPVDPRDLPKIEDGVCDRLRHEGFERRHPGLRLAFGSARPPFGDEHRLYLWVCRWYPVADMASISERLNSSAPENHQDSTAWGSPINAARLSAAAKERGGGRNGPVKIVAR